MGRQQYDQVRHHCTILLPHFLTQWPATTSGTDTKGLLKTSKEVFECQRVLTEEQKPTLFSYFYIVLPGKIVVISFLVDTSFGGTQEDWIYLWVCCQGFLRHELCLISELEVSRMSVGRSPSLKSEGPKVSEEQEVREGKETSNIHCFRYILFIQTIERTNVLIRSSSTIDLMIQTHQSCHSFLATP